MRWMLLGLLIGILSLAPPYAIAGDTENRILNGVISGLLGPTPQQANAVSLQQEQGRLASLLQSGEYATSRQGEPVDMIVLGIPLTHTDHVYEAKLVPPSKTRY